MSLKRITYQTNLNANSVAVWEWDIKRDTFSGTAEFLSLFEVSGNSKPVLSKEHLLQYVHPKQYNELSQILDNVSKGLTDKIHFECRFKKSQSGNYEWLSFKGAVTEYNHHHKPIKLIGFCQSIEEKKEIENQLKECEERWFNTMALSGAGFWDYEIATDQLFFSIQMKNILGYLSREALPGQGSFWRGRIHPDDRSIVAALEESEATKGGE